MLNVIDFTLGAVSYSTLLGGSYAFQGLIAGSLVSEGAAQIGAYAGACIGASSGLVAGYLDYSSRHRKSLDKMIDLIRLGGVENGKTVV